MKEIELVCPMCGWELKDLDQNQVGICRKCREYVVGELPPEVSEYEDTDLIAEVQAEFDAEAEQDAYEANSENYGYDDDFNYRDRFFLDGEIL